MLRFWILSFALLQISVPSSQVNISPCKVENMMTQPIYGTSSKTKALVQIIQIPPVFTQNVMVGKCLNTKEGSGYLLEPGHSGDQYFLCRQRYTTVEVYISESNDVSHPPRNGTNQSDLSPLKIFKTLNFVRDSVLVESGCDFTFNLLPLLLPQNPPPQLRRHEVQPHIYHFLRSPYHPSHPEHEEPNTLQPNSTSFSQSIYPQTHTNSQGGNQILYGQGHGRGSEVQQQQQNTYQAAPNPNIPVRAYVDRPSGIANPYSQQPSIIVQHESYKLHGSNTQRQTPPVIDTQNSSESQILYNNPFTGTISSVPIQASRFGVRHQNFSSTGKGPSHNNQLIGYPVQGNGDLRERADSSSNDINESDESDNQFVDNSGSYQPGNTQYISPSATFVDERITVEEKYNSPGSGNSYFQSQQIPNLQDTSDGQQLYNNYPVSNRSENEDYITGNKYEKGIISTSYPVISDYTLNSTHSENEGEKSYIYTSPVAAIDTQGYVSGIRNEAELYTLPDKIGVPLFILSRKFDPLLKNIEGDHYYKI